MQVPRLGLAWERPEFVQLFVMDQEQVYFRVWIIHRAELRQIVPEGREERVWSAGASRRLTAPTLRGRAAGS
ncbi:hypothetical protein ACGFZP_15270 [Kitasatospora sp. NPDC048239]|uniref:hypothetical protein n=1 Tax=Kitasatospora sp. NPDC048239 TaxID=3364046 RepID=UPI003713F120